jgi:hypothetical protein
LGLRGLKNLHCGCAIAALISAATVSFACDQLPPGQSLWIRLDTPVSTYTAKPGDPVRALLTQDLVCEDRIVLPMGAPVQGVVKRTRKVGWGIRHETASLELEFDRATADDGTPINLAARVEEVDNAREQVRNGVVQGIRSTDTFQGSINSRLIHLPTWNPYSDTVLIAYKAVFPIFPEPEIYYPAGTEMRLKTTAEISVPSEADASQETPSSKAEADELEQMVRQLPWRVTTTRHIDADVLNIMFLGSEEQVKAAFSAAGWRNPDPHTKTAWMKNLYSLLDNNGYSQQPMTTFLLDDKPEDMDWQMSLNSYGRRDHLRIWQWNPEGSSQPVWLTSSTHDTSAVLAIKYKGFVHHIAPKIDEERATVIRDLRFSGCVKTVSYVARPELPATIQNATGDKMQTDGSIAVVTLQDCKPLSQQVAPDQQIKSYRPGNYAFRYIRRQILTFRNDIFRANIIYGSYDVGRRTWLAERHRTHPEQSGN